MNLKIMIVVIAAAIIALGWAALRESAPVVPAAHELTTESARVAPANPLDDFPLHGEEDMELEEFRVVGEAIPTPAEWRSGMFRPLVDAWAELAPRAEEGDARAAMQLFLALDMCRRTLQPTDHERRVQAEIATATPPDPDPERIREVERNCAAADPAWLDTGLDWLTQAADGGLVGAQLMWVTRASSYLDLENADDATRQWHAQMSRRYLSEAVDSGSTQAMMLVFRLDSTDDPVNALAHAALAYRVIDERVRAAGLTPNHAHPRRQRYAERQLQNLQSLVILGSERLSDAHIAVAHRRADELYERCCL